MMSRPTNLPSRWYGWWRSCPIANRYFSRKKGNCQLLARSWPELRVTSKMMATSSSNHSQYEGWRVFRRILKGRSRNPSSRMPRPVRHSKQDILKCRSLRVRLLYVLRVPTNKCSGYKCFDIFTSRLRPHAAVKNGSRLECRRAEVRVHRHQPQKDRFSKFCCRDLGCLGANEQIWR